MPAQIAIHTVRIRPIRLHGDRVKALLIDEAASEPSALVVELVRSVARFPNENKTSVTDLIEERVVVAARARQRLHRSADTFGIANLGFIPVKDPIHDRHCLVSP
jgi:hypothetical protein